MKGLNLLKTGLAYGIFMLLIQLNLYAQKSEFSYVCPMPGSANLNPEQNIILACSDGFDLATVNSEKFNISGSISGPVMVDFIFPDGEDKIIIKPLNPFSLGETVAVEILDGIMTKRSRDIKAYKFFFTVIDHDRKKVRSQLNNYLYENEAAAMRPFPNTYGGKDFTENSLPPDYPAPTVNNFGDHDHEYVFINMNKRDPNLPWSPYLTILDSYGVPIYYQRKETSIINFYVLPNGLLTFAKNFIGNIPEEKYFIMDSAYVIIDSVNTGNGYILDAHEMLLLSNGHYLVMSYDPQPVDMSLIVSGGNPNAIVTGLVLQEVDNNENVYFQWRSWDHFEITDATYDINLTAPFIDYVHGNALELDTDGNILLSSRNMDEVTKIDFSSGAVIWRFGKNCENNMFQIIDDPHGFSHQHDIRKLPNGNYTIFDNGNNHSPQFSQALEYQINQYTMTARLVWNYQHNPQAYASSMGSFRTDDNGDRIIGWGGINELAVTELDKDDNLLREYFLPDFIASYRAIKGPWETNVFKTREKLSMGNYNGHTGYKENYLFIFNESNEVIKITSIHNHLSEYTVDAAFPIPIFPNSYRPITVLFQPGQDGIFTDRMTLNYDNEDNTKRIARQLEISGKYDNNIPSVIFNPYHGATNVNPDTEIQITFGEPVRKVFGGEIENDDIPSLFDLKKEYFNGADVQFTGEINDEKTQITIYPNMPLSEQQQYYVLLKKGLIADYDNNIIDLDEERYFMTGIMTSVDPLEESSVCIYPNPFQDHLIIENESDSESLIRIYDASGLLIKEIRNSHFMNSINMSAYAAGIYFIKIVDKKSGESMVYKTIKNTTLY